MEFTPEVIGGIVGLVLTVTFAYFPKFRVWYGGLVSETKSLIMIGMLITTGLVITLLAQYGVITTAEPVTWFTFAKVVTYALIVNQPAYKILPEAADVKAAKAARPQ